MENDPLNEKRDCVYFEKVVDEIHGYLANRGFIVSRLTLRRALLAYAAQEGVMPTSGAKIAHAALESHLLTPAQLINLA